MAESQKPTLGYKWVVASNVLDLDSPQFWHSRFIGSSEFESGGADTLGTRIVREYAGRIIVVDSFPIINSESSQWHFYGWVLPPQNESVIDYNSVQLSVEVLTSSEPAILHKVYDLDRTALPKSLIEEGFSDSSEENDYAFLVLIEGHSRATLLKELCRSLESEVPGFDIERIREDNESLTIFGKISDGEWNLSTQVHRVKGTYETTFKLWRKRAEVKSDGRNNPSIVSEEEQYYSGEASRTDMLKISLNHLYDSLQSYA